MKPHPALRLLMFVTALLLPTAVPAAEFYRIDPQHTFSTFEYEHWGLSLQRGRFDSNTGTIALDTATGNGAIDIEIAAVSISTGSALFDTILRSADFFSAAVHPKITFKSTRLIFAGERLMQVEGLLTIKAISRSVTLDVTRFDCRFMPAYGKRACGANGSARLSRSDFELGKYVPFVSDIVTLYVSVEAIKED
ncbi:MAG: YceI family protein [Herminiimonas sp.]|nr:YceI family protein [Herminiimonas sp.]